MPFVEMWMDLESIIQNEVSQKEKNEYCILMHICGIQENGINESILQSRNRDTDIENKYMDTKREKGG